MVERNALSAFIGKHVHVSLKDRNVPLRGWITHQGECTAANETEIIVGGRRIFLHDIVSVAELNPVRKVSKCAICQYCKGRANPPRFWKCGVNFEKFVTGDPDGEPFEMDEKGNVVLSTDPCPDYKNEWDYKRSN